VATRPPNEPEKAVQIEMTAQSIMIPTRKGAGRTFVMIIFEGTPEEGREEGGEGA
jgi:hypothetical protein